MIKKIVFLLIILLLIAAAALAWFVLTFDAEHYKPIIQAKAQEAIGNPIEIGNIALDWRQGLSLRLENVSVFPEGGSAQQAPLQLDEAYVLLRLMPLLRQDLEFGKIILDHPRITLTQTTEGKVIVPGLRLPEESPDGAGAVVLPFLIENIEIEDGEILFESHVGNVLRRVPVKDLDVRVSNVSLYRPLKFVIKASLFSRSQNLQARGRLSFDLSSGAVTFEDTHFETDLSDWDLTEAKRNLPDLQAAGLGNDPSGKVFLDAEKILIDPEKQPQIQASLSVENGSIDLEALPLPVSNLQLNAELRQEKLEVKKLEARLGDAHIQGSLDGEAFFSRPVWRVDAEVKNLDLKQVSQPVPAGAAQLQGILSAKFQSTAAGWSSEDMLMTARGDGELGVREGVITNFNLLREVLNKLSMLPGLVDRLKARLPESYQEKISAKDTRVDDFSWPFSVNQGALMLPRMEMGTDSFQLTGRGSATLAGAIGFQTMLMMDPDLSEAFIRSVEELKLLTDKQGRLQLPVSIQGTVQRPLVYPDLGYVASRLATQKAQQWIGELLGGKSQQETPTRKVPVEGAADEAGSVAAPAQTGQSSPQPGQPSGSDLLQGFLNQALGGKTSTSSPPKTGGGTSSGSSSDLLGGLLQAALGGSSGSAQQGASEASP